MQAGTLLAQRYRVEEKLGEGGMGVVYKAHDTLLDRPVALKALAPHLLGDGSLRRLLREAQSAAKLTHPNIVAIHDVVEDDATRLIVMEYIEGQTLRSLIPLSWERAIDVGLDVCRALSFAHDRGVVHRDIKPENVIVTPEGAAKVMDFGLARSEGRSRLTQTGAIVGTVAYMAPEQALSGRADARSDLYSVGAVLYEAITGKPPFEAEDPIAVISMHVNVPPVSPRFYTPAIPPVLEAVILRLLAKDPTERYASADELSRILQTTLVSVEAPDEVAPVADARVTVASLLDMMTRGRLIDREEELASLKSALESVLSGRGQVVLVDGEPGIGKTRLVDELLVYARLRGCLAAVGRCYEQEVNVPYLPFADALRTLLQGIPDDRLTAAAGLFASELVKLVPDLAQRIPGLVPSPPLEPDQERLRLYQSITRFVTDLARTQSLVVVLDDLHWADAATLQLLRYLARNIRAERVLIVGTYRDVEVDRAHPLSSALSEMNRERLYRRVLVRRLTPQHVAAMIQSIFQARQPVSDELRDLIYTETEGNPFFVEEILKHLVEAGALYMEDGRWQRKEIAEIDVPRSIREVIGRRLEQVSAPCQRVLTLAAVIGRRFKFEVLQPVGELGEEELLNALEEATQVQLVREEPDAGEVEYDFAHALIREVLYERLGLRRRMTLHQKVGETMERLYAGRLDGVIEDLAHHFTRAPHGAGFEKAIRYSLEAARKAMGLFAHEEAVRHFRNAIELMEEAGDERRLAETQIALGEPFVYLGDTKSAVEVYERALKFFERQGAPTDVARVHRLIGRALQRRWEFSEAIPHLERALQELNPEEQAEDVIQIHLDLARARSFMGKIDEAQKHAEQALGLARVHGAVALQAAAYASLGLIAYSRLDLDGAMVHFKEAIRLAREISDPEAYFTLQRSLNNLALLHQVRGEHAAAKRLLLETLEASERVRNLQQISFANIRLGYYNFVHGDWQAAKQYAIENLQMSLSLDDLQDAERLLRWLEGNWEAAASLDGTLLQHYRRTGNVQGIFLYCVSLAWASVALGRVQEAREAAAEAATIAENDPHHLCHPYIAFILEGLAQGGDYDRCEALCARAEAVNRAAKSPHGVASVLFGRGVLAFERRNHDAAVQLLDEALPLAKPLPVLHAHMLHKLAQVLGQRKAPGDIERVKKICQECLRLLEQMGDTRKADQVRTELAALS